MKHLKDPQIAAYASRFLLEGLPARNNPHPLSSIHLIRVVKGLQQEVANPPHPERGDFAIATKPLRS